MMLLVRIVCGIFILMVVLPDVVLPQCHPDTPILLDLFQRNTGSNQITLRCRWCNNFLNIQDPHLFVNSTDMPLLFRLENGLLAFTISQELEGYYYCGASPNSIGSNNVTLIGESLSVGSYIYQAYGELR